MHYRFIASRTGGNILVLLILIHAVTASKIKRLGAPVEIDDHTQHRELNVFRRKRKRRPIKNIVNEAGKALDTAGNGVGRTVDTIGNGVGDVVDNIGDGIGDAVDAVGGAVSNAFNDMADSIRDALGGIVGIGQRCGLGGWCPGDLECQGGAITGLCLPVKCITENVIKHANYFGKMLDKENGGGVEFAKNYTRNNPEERDSVGADFSSCFSRGDDGSGERNLAGRIKPIHAIGALGDISLLLSGTAFYSYVIGESTADNKAGNILGFCGGAGVGAGFSIQPMYDMIFAGKANDAQGSWTFARFEVRIPAPPVIPLPPLIPAVPIPVLIPNPGLALGFGVHVGINAAGAISDVVGGSLPVFALRLTAILPLVGGLGGNFFNLALCQSVNAG